MQSALLYLLKKAIFISDKVRNIKLSESMTNMFNVSKNINYNLRSNKVKFDLQIQIL